MTSNDLSPPGLFIGSGDSSPHNYNMEGGIKGH